MKPGYLGQVSLLPAGVAEELGTILGHMIRRVTQRTECVAPSRPVPARGFCKRTFNTGLSEISVSNYLLLYGLDKDDSSLSNLKNSNIYK